MANVTRRIGLSLGADICWPICYEEILKRLDLKLSLGRDLVRFETDRVTIEPFELRQPCQYDVVIDRLTHWYHTSREWIKKAVVMDDLYVFNNPWSVQSMEKHSTYCAMMHLGLPVPRTVMLPPKSYAPNPDLQHTLERYARMFDLNEIGEKMGYPFFMKPYDGGGWTGVTRIRDAQGLHEAYDQSGTRVMHLQEAIDPHDVFVRCVGLGPQTRIIRYDPFAPLHSRYTMDRNFVEDEDASLLRDMTLTINTFFGWDFNSCEALRRDGVWHPIDFANPCPDSQVTSLHYHFPWMIKANIRWSVFCAATQREMQLNMNWKPFYAIRKKDLPYRERLAAYADLARERLSADHFEDFCRKHLAHLDEVTWEFFGTDQARDAIHQKVVALYPEHEVESFTDLFCERVATWREQEGRQEDIPAPARVVAARVETERSETAAAQVVHVSPTTSAAKKPTEKAKPRAKARAPRSETTRSKNARGK